MSKKYLHALSHYPRLCLAFLFLWSVAWAISPNYRTVWLYENGLVFIGVPLTIWLHARWRLSNASWTVITIFLSFHVVGAHYTYSEVPLFQPAESSSLDRNHYDRLVHFLFGLLITYPVRELFRRTTQARAFWVFFVPLAMVVASSVLYEFIEWGMMLVTDPDAGMTFLGAQGDIWDGHKDMALATIGSILTLVASRGCGDRSGDAALRALRRR